MKTNKLLVATIATLIFASCNLNQLPDGSSLTEEQTDEISDFFIGAVRGTYASMFEYGGSHESFGQRSLDMYGDLSCGDMTLAVRGYGWFQTDELGQTYTRRGTFWSYYYGIIRQCNIAINALEKLGELPEIPVPAGLTTTEYEYGYYYGQALAMRGWAYAGLQRSFCRMKSEDVDYDTELSVPIYTEDDTRVDTILGAPRSTAAEVNLQIKNDLQRGIQYLEAYEGYVNTTNKMELTADAAKLILAYSYINASNWADLNDANRQLYEDAYVLAKEVIDAGHYQILPQNELLTTGFNSVDNKSWMWGEEVTVETSTSLASFFAQCDIHSYGYAWAGAVKGIDSKLYDDMYTWDGRKNWFLTPAGYGGRTTYAYAPEGKFYCSKTKHTIKSSEIDRDWQCDNVFMRIELAYLIAAEAALYKNTPDLAESRNMLDAIMSQRMNDNNANSASEYASYLAGLSDATSLKDAVIYNWRIELWGEGYGLQTFRRLSHSVTLGTNHMNTSRRQATLNYSDAGIYTYEIPTSETRYNPYMRDDELTDSGN